MAGRQLTKSHERLSTTMLGRPSRKSNERFYGENDFTVVLDGHYLGKW